MRLSVISLASLILVFAACTTFTKNECLDMDWHSRGQTAALHGESSEAGLDYYQRECGKTHGVAPDASLFQTGFDEGLKKFCTPEYGLKHGARGGKYRGTCPEEAAEKFTQNYTSGRVQFLGERVADLEYQVSSLKSENSRLKSEVSTLKGKTTSCKTR